MTISPGSRPLCDIQQTNITCQSAEPAEPCKPVRLSHELPDETKLYTCHRLNQLLADTQVLHASFQKHHRQMRRESTYQIHLLLRKFAAEQGCLTESLSERIQNLGGCAVVDPRHIAELTRIPREPNCVEQVPAVLSRLLNATELILIDAYMAATQIGELSGTSADPGISELIRIDETHARSLCQLIAKHRKQIHVA